jgi:hypothetical protein
MASWRPRITMLKRAETVWEENSFATMANVNWRGWLTTIFMMIMMILSVTIRDDNRWWRHKPTHIAKIRMSLTHTNTLTHTCLRLSGDNFLYIFLTATFMEAASLHNVCKSELCAMAAENADLSMWFSCNALGLYVENTWFYSRCTTFCGSSFRTKSNPACN